MQPLQEEAPPLVRQPPPNSCPPLQQVTSLLLQASREQASLRLEATGLSVTLALPPSPS
jgi:hypothetical protein